MASTFLAFSAGIFCGPVVRAALLKSIILNSTLIFRPPSHCHRFLQVLSRFWRKKIEKKAS